MKRHQNLTIFLTLLFLSACSGLPGLGDESDVIPTRLILPTATAGGVVSALPKNDASMSLVWFFNPTERTLLGVDNTTHVVTVKVLTTFNPQLITSDRDAIWATEEIDDTLTSLLRIDAQSKTVTDNIAIPYGRVTSLSAAGDYVWMSIKEPGGTAAQPKGGVVQVDAASRAIFRYFSTSAYPLQVVATDGTAWVLEQDELNTFFERIDSTNGNLTTLPKDVQSSADIQLFSRFSIQGNDIWALPLQPHAAYIFHVDANSGKLLEKIKIGSTAAEHPLDILAADNQIYIALANSSIISLSPQKGILSAPVNLPAAVTRLFSSPNGIWAWSYQNASAYQIDTQNNLMVASVSLGATPAPTTTPSVYPTMAIIGENKPCEGIDFASDLKPGMRAIVNPDPPLPNRVRESPTKSAAVVDVVNPAHWVEILEGPACVEGRVWWRVHTQNNLYGWTPEGDGIEHWLIPEPEENSSE